MEDLSRQGLQFRNGHALLADLMSIGEFPVVVVVYPDPNRADESQRTDC
jgi:hypothetical protein